MITIKSARLKIKKIKLNEKELNEIREILEYASDKYYNSDEIFMSNTEYDYMYERYLELGGEPFVGAKPRGNDDEDEKDSRIVDTEHKYPKLVGTTIKCHNIKEFNEWIEKVYSTLNLKPSNNITINITLKFDGNSILIEYDEKGKVKRALTRGRDGKGKDLSKIFKHKMFKINNPFEVPIAIKFECLLRYSNIPKIEEKFGKLYKNPRNGVSGMLNGNDGELYRDFYTLEPLWFDIDSEHKDEVIDNIIYSNSEEFESFRDIELSFLSEEFKDSDTIEYLYRFEGNLEEIKEYVENVHDDILSYREDLDFMIDGMVIDIDSDEYREKLGYIINSENPTPKWCSALKFPYMELESEVIDIKYSVGDSGRVSPVCHFKPVKMANGTTHSKQYLQGYKRFKELKLCKGTRILIQLHNDTLSYIERLDSIKDDKKAGRKPIKFIKNCPICGEKLEITKNSDGEETFVYCVNEFCQGRAIGRINNYLIKMDIKGIKTKTIEKLHNAGLWNNIQDIYTFDYEKAYEIEGLGKSSIDSIVKSVNRKKYYDYEILGSLGIKNFGIDTSKEIFKKFSIYELMSSVKTAKEIDTIINKINKKYPYESVIPNKKDEKILMAKSREFENIYENLLERLMSIDGIAEKLAVNIIDGMIKNYELISFLISRGFKQLKDEQCFDENTYTFVVTGDLNVCGRDQLKKILERHGHKLTGSVSSKTDYLVTNFPNSNTVKIKKARELGTKIINEEELISLLGYDMQSEIKKVKQLY